MALREQALYNIAHFNKEGCNLALCQQTENAAGGT